MAKIMFVNPITKKEHPITRETVCYAAAVVMTGVVSGIGGAMIQKTNDAAYMVEDKDLARIYRRWYNKMPGGVTYDFFSDVGRSGFELKNPFFYGVSQDDEEMLFDKIRGDIPLESMMNDIENIPNAE